MRPFHAGSDAGIPERRVRTLIEELRESAAQRRRTGRGIALAGTGLAIACILGLSGVTRMAQRLDTDAVAQIGRGELVAHLPTTRAAIQQQLESQAPEIVRTSLDNLLAYLPELRRLATARLIAHLDAMNGAFEERIVGVMRESIPAARERLAASWPDLDEDERVERLVNEVAADFERSFQEAIEALYPEYRAEMTQLVAQLTQLRDANPAHLTEEERLQREIIETMLRLVLREGVTEES